MIKDKFQEDHQIDETGYSVMVAVLTALNEELLVIRRAFFSSLFDRILHLSLFRLFYVQNIVKIFAFFWRWQEGDNMLIV